MLSSALSVSLPPTPNGLSMVMPVIASATFFGSVLLVFFIASMTNLAPLAFSHDQFTGNSLNFFRYSAAQSAFSLVGGKVAR